MAKRKNSNTTNDGTTANLGFEVELWAAADALRNKLLTGTARFAGWAEV